MANARPGGQRLVIYDRTCGGDPLGLSDVWHAGAWLYTATYGIDARCGVSSWQQAFDWLDQRAACAPIAEVQYWGHGKWGSARVGQESLDQQSIAPGGCHHQRLLALRDALARDGQQPPLFWFRTCETFGAHVGQRFAEELASLLSCRVAGHTYVIAYYQSGLHALDAGQQANWPADEGLAEGSATAPVRAHPSRRSAPNTITCLRGSLPQKVVAACRERRDQQD